MKLTLFFTAKVPSVNPWGEVIYPWDFFHSSESEVKSRNNSVWKIFPCTLRKAEEKKVKIQFYSSSFVTAENFWFIGRDQRKNFLTSKIKFHFSSQTTVKMITKRSLRRSLKRDVLSVRNLLTVYSRLFREKKKFI
jgi:hypothetical protein